jgi:uncharacterized membrane protein YhaH (DUF805 family)
MNLFKSRLKRSGFLLWSIIVGILWVVIIELELSSVSFNPILGILCWTILSVFTIIILIRRLQDIGYSKWYVLLLIFIIISFVPILWLVLFFIPTQTVNSSS